MSEHICPRTPFDYTYGRRLNVCLAHPRWYVWKDTDQVEWVATPGVDSRSASSFDEGFPTHAEAVAYATEMARADQLAAIQGAGTASKYAPGGWVQ